MGRRVPSLLLAVFTIAVVLGSQVGCGGTATVSNPETTVATTSTTATAARAQVVKVETQIVGDPAAMHAPPEEMILKLPEGSGVGQFGIATSGGPMDISFAISPDLGTMALNDGVNHRMLLFGLDGEELGEFATPQLTTGMSTYRDIVFADDNHLVVQTLFDDDAAVVVDMGGTVVNTIASGWSADFGFDFLVKDGADVWASGIEMRPDGDCMVSYPLIRDGVVLSPDQSAAEEKLARVCAHATFCCTLTGSQRFEAVVEPFDGKEFTWTITSELPIESGDVIGTDRQGGYYLLLRLSIGEQGAYCVTGISKTGEYLGQVVWPYTYRYGGGIVIGPEGAVYECRTTADGVEMVRYELTR